MLAEEKEEKAAVAGDDGDRGERGRERQDWERGKWETEEEGRPQRGADTLGGDCGGGRAAMKRLRWKLESKSKKISFLTLRIFFLAVFPPDRFRRRLLGILLYPSEVPLRAGTSARPSAAAE